MPSNLQSTGKAIDTISRRDALKSLGGVIAASAVSGRADTAPFSKQSGAMQASPGTLPKNPNILWITGEGVPISALSCYGSKLIETPNIDRIAKEGVRFVNSFCTNGLCAPSRATLLTGTYNHINGMLSNPDVGNLPEDEVPHFDTAQETFPKILKRHGYQTGMVGKWHLPVNPAKTGFDYFMYKEGAGGPYYEPTGFLGNPSLGSEEIQKYRIEGYETDVMTDLVIKGMQQFKQPFLMMVQFFNAHRPFDPPHKYEHLYDNVRIPEPGTFWDNYEHRASPARDARMRIEDMPDFHPPDDLTARQRKQWNYQRFVEHFLGTLRSQDDNIGRLLEYLEKNGLAENTIVVYTTDHGFFMGDHGWFDKRFMYEQAICVPWMIRCPGLGAPGTVRNDWVINIDNAPTALDLVGLPIPAEMQGKSILPILRGDTQPAEAPALYYHYYEFGSPHWVAPHYGIRTERYKLISYYDRNEWELFDLEKDPDEMESLIIDNGRRVQPGYEGVVQDLVGKLKQMRERYKDTTGRPVKLQLLGD
ncbi:Mucin-desulfating sulfatase (N-acetylglucosamine-6-sulfatase) [Candidatus Sulfotelmatomonas gaucii]|uniref:Mucin-desulfating sulfatase (N-acetylglucosamine-6-sulfatase) n=1 Tax=Candidatus Sulfuritelmatomonas gaucii TaxID=2043161 RepID=A0A2N9M7B1_9BACT|nr:Mucin-desulfating sulfatase (N-acetylglucosamine-6-sulfatase) [Candidatus Sulfotelmatomonas gaucii]